MLFYLILIIKEQEKITIKSNTKIGLNSGIIKDINEEGLYFGCPAKQIKYAKSN